MKTTLNQIRAHSPCPDGWRKLLAHLGKSQADDEPLAITTILDSNGLDDALWCLRAVKGHDREIRLYAVWCARQVQHLMTDPRSIAALDVAERFATGAATQVELTAAWDETRAATGFAAEDAARATARFAAEDAAGAAAGVAAWATAEDAARATAWATAGVEAGVAARDAQKIKLREICGGAK